MILLVLLLIGSSVTGATPPVPTTSSCGGSPPPPSTPPVPVIPLSCGISPVSRVIGGVDATPGNWPWQIALLRGSSKSFSCGGSLIAPDWIVTAAHCIARGQPGSYYTIRLGDHNRQVTEGTEQDIPGKQVIVHPDYNKIPIDSDIALIQLSRPATLNARVKTVCLPSHDEVVPTSSRCFITGWGKIKHPGSSHHILQQANLPSVTNDVCAKKLAASPGGSSLRITQNMICGGVKGTILSGCHGDSGGPYVCQNSAGNWVLQGAVSWGSPRCSAAERYTVFARVGKFRNWINQMMGVSPTPSQGPNPSSGGSPPPPSTPPVPTTPSGSECSNYQVLNDADRAKGYKAVNNFKCDKPFITRWYKFEGDAGNQMPDKCVDKYHCGTHAPGWLNGTHPTVAEGVVRLKVCFSWSSGCCQWNSDIRVRNCGGFYVYQLPQAPGCQMRYCGNKDQGVSTPLPVTTSPPTPPPPSTPPVPTSSGDNGCGSSSPATPQPPTTPVGVNECSNYQVLNDADRAKGYKANNNFKCDKSLITRWYKFEGAAGNQMPDKSVPTYHCGTHAPGWLNGAHPTVAEGVVTRTVCFHWTSKDCQWQTSIRVRNCGGFYVYELRPAPGCNMRYCGDKDQVTAPPPTIPSSPPPTIPGSPPPPGSCGIRPQSRIVGGTNAKHGDWPWQAQLRTTGGFPYCGGTLVSDQWVVTATHCVQGKSASSIIIRLGAHRRVNIVGTEQDIRVSKVITHPSYHKPTRYSHDIALLKLEKPAQLNRNVNLVCLPQAIPEPTDGIKCWITGWGTLSSGGSTPDILQQASVPVVSRARCDRAYPNKIHDSMICAGLDQGGIDSCQGDSGGPMVCESGGRFYLHGATSWGYGCASAGKFGVYAKVKYLLSWVNSEMSKN